MLKKMALVLLALTLLAACAPQPTATAEPSPTPLVHIKLPMGYIPNVQYAPFYVADDRGYYRDAGIEVEFDYSFETDGVQLVGANTLQFSLASGEQVLLARAQGLPVVYVMAFYQKYPISVISRADLGIRTPQDLRGKKIGLPGLFGANYVGLRALLFSAGVKESEVTLDSIGFTQVEALATGQDDAVVGYAANEPVVLHYKGYQLNEIRVADYVQLASNGILSKWYDFDAIRLPFEPEMWLVPLHGHTRGQCGVAIKTPTGWHFHVGDAGVDLERNQAPDWMIIAGLGPHWPRLRAFARAHPEVKLTAGHMVLDFFEGQPA